jgi:hypothetical protein
MPQSVLICVHLWFGLVRPSDETPALARYNPAPMVQINDHYLKLKAGYLFPEIARRVQAFAAAHPQARIIRLGIGDVTEPLAPAVIAAMHAAVDEVRGSPGGRASPGPAVLWYGRPDGRAGRALLLASLVLSAAAAPALAALSILAVWPGYERVLWVTTVLGLAAAMSAVFGGWRARIGAAVPRRFLIAASLGLLVFASGPIVIRYDTPLYRQPAARFVCLPGLRVETRQAIDRKLREASSRPAAENSSPAP